MSRSFRARHLCLFAALLAPAAGCASIEDQIAETASDDQEDRIEAINDLTEGVREEDASHLEHREAIGKVVEAALDDPSPLVRQVAIEGVATVQGTGGTSAIIDRLRDKDSWVRYAATRALGDLPTEASRKALEDTLARDKTADVRRQAARSLRKLNAKASIRPLYLGLGDPSPSVRQQCLLSLQHITGKQHGPDVRAWRNEVPSE
jgi:HEAT repeat protein